MKKKYLITGASRGIGLSISQKLLEEGAEILGLSRKGSLSHDNYLHIPFDLSSIEKLPKLAEEIAKNHPDVDGIVCNAGFGRFGNLEEFSYSQIQEVMAVNFLSHAYLARAFIPLMKKRKSGFILFIGSEAALEGKKKGAIYCASKFALRGFAQALREECSTQGIQVTLINPGPVNNSFYENLAFKPGSEADEHIASEDIASLVSAILKMRKGTVIDEINLSPQKNKIIFT